MRRSLLLLVVLTVGLAVPAAARAATPSGFSIVALPHLQYGGYLSAVAATYDGGHSDVWAVGVQYTQTAGTFNPLILRSTGGAWHRVTLPWSLSDTTLTDIAATQGAHPGVWITAEPGTTAANPNPSPLLLHWQPSGWAKTTAPAPYSLGGFWTVGADSSGDVWASGWSADSDDCCTYPFVDRLSGGTWNTVPSPFSGPDYFECCGFSAVQPLSPTDAWGTMVYGPVCCDGVSGSSLFHYSAGTWQQEGLPCSNLDGEQFCEAEDMVAPTSSDSDIWAVGWDNLQAAMWHRNGSTTTEYDPWNYTTSHALAGVVARGPSDVWAVGTRENAAGARRTLIVHWNDTTWADLGGPNTQDDSTLTDITAAPHTGTLWAVGDSYNTNGSYSTDTQPLILRHP